MLFTLKNYTAQFTKEQIQKAEKYKVRECDETEKGTFIAYVDDGADSFDVSITILTKGEISNSTCDCGSKISFCRHKLALLMNLANDKKSKPAGLPKK